MSGYFDSYGDPLRVDDYVRYLSWTDALFQVEGLQYPSDAIIRNVIPGNAIGTSTVSCRSLTRAVNNPPQIKPGWFDDRYEDPDFSPLFGTLLPCGCHLRRVDMEAVLCPQHIVEVNGG